VSIIEVFADAGCPFAHVGLRRLVEYRARAGRHDVVLRVRAWPLELVNGHPLDPAFIAEEVDEIRTQVAPDLFVGFTQGAFPATSLRAMALSIRAYEMSDTTGEQVSLAVRDALFERGLDIADASVLKTIADRYGVPVGADLSSDAELVRRDWEEGAARGVVGSPHFVLSAGDFFCPALRIDRVDGHLRIVADDQAFAEFMTQAFAN
jgi:predicted DsbA family dithiol-disulfide isomerase